MKSICLALFLVGWILSQANGQETNLPVKFAIMGLTHDHAGGFIPNTLRRKDIQLVGIVETNTDLVARYGERYHLPANFFYPSLKALIAHTNIDAVATFTSTYDHLAVAKNCAALGVRVMMMEKPLAVDLKQGQAMADIANQKGMQMIVNYETTWYSANQAAYTLVHDQVIGDLRRIVVHDGHWGPRELGCSSNFLAWLTDPVLNGGGALMDFGCYGADLMTWLMDGARPTSVMAVTQHIKPEVYPKVEDEATIIVTYPKAQGIIQASWNWPYNRKDMEIYGQTGYVLVPKNDTLRILKNRGTETEQTVPGLKGAQADPLSYLAAVVRGEIKPGGLSSLSVNLAVMEILDAARKSAQTGRRVDLPKRPPYAVN